MRRKKSLLVIEDDLELLNLIKEFLCDEYKVITSQDGSEGLFKFRNEVFDLVISYFNLPKMTGEDFTREFLKIKQRKPEEYKNTKLMMISDQFFLDKLSKSMKEKIYCLSKPFGREDLLEKVNLIINNHDVERDTKRIFVKKGTILIKQEDLSVGSFMLLKGSILIQFLDESSKIIKPGESFGDIEALTGEKSNYLAEALEDSELYLIPTKHISEYIKKQPIFMKLMINNLIKKNLKGAA